MSNQFATADRIRKVSNMWSQWHYANQDVADAGTRAGVLMGEDLDDDQCYAAVDMDNLQGMRRRALADLFEAFYNVCEEAMEDTATAAIHAARAPAMNTSAENVAQFACWKALKALPGITVP